jgi:hypothetical protein
MGSVPALALRGGATAATGVPTDPPSGSAPTGQHLKRKASSEAKRGGGSGGGGETAPSGGEGEQCGGGSGSAPSRSQMSVGEPPTTVNSGRQPGQPAEPPGTRDGDGLRRSSGGDAAGCGRRGAEARARGDGSSPPRPSMPPVAGSPVLCSYTGHRNRQTVKVGSTASGQRGAKVK